MIARRAWPWLLLAAFGAAPREAPVGPARPGGALPARFLVDASGRPRTVWAAAEGDRPLARPDRDSPVAAGTAPTRFLEPYHTAEEFLDPKGTAYRLVARPGDSRFAGWLRADRLVTRTGAEMAPGSNVARKVILVETADSLGRAKTVQGLTIRPRLAPRDEALTGDGLRVPSLFFRYGAADGFVLLGTAPMLDPARARSTVLGWVRAERTIAFDGRLAAEWDAPSTGEKAAPRRASPGLIFRSRKDAYAAIRAEAGDPIPEPLAREVRDDHGGAFPFQPADPRFPVLDYPDDDPDHPEVDALTGNRLLKLGGLGGFLEEREIASSQDEIKRAERERDGLLKKLDEPLQIVFVVDDTESMQQSFEAVARTIDAILKAARGHDRRAVEVSVCYYNESNGVKGRGYEVRPLRDARNEAASQIPDQVRGHRVQGGGDYREDVFAGLIAAVEGVGFESHRSAQRVVILIGDHGDKSDERDPERADAVVAALLDSRRKPVVFAAIQVVRPPADDPNPDRRPRPGVGPSPEEQTLPIGKQSACAAWAFKVQMETIVKKLQAHDQEFGFALGSYKVIPRDASPDVGDLATALNAEVARAERKKAEIEEKYRALQARQFHTRIEPHFVALLEDVNAPVADLRKLAGARVGYEGYAWRWARGGVPEGDEPGTPQLRLRVLLSAGEIDRLLAAIDPIVSAPNIGRALAVWSELPALRDRGSFEETILRPLGLPARSPLLLRPPGKVGGSAAERELRGLRQRAAALRALRALRDGPATQSRYFGIPEGSPPVWCWADYDAELP